MFAQLGWNADDRFSSFGVIFAESLGLSAFHQTGETAIELTYRAELAKWLVLRPDVQIILRKDVEPAIAAGLRVEVSF